MKKRIITISREYGSGGRKIGAMLAEELGIPFYDRELIAKVAGETGLSQQYIERQGEYSPKRGIFAYAFAGRNSAGESLDDYLYSVQRDIILELAQKESCVIVGRCADYILRDRDDCINAFIHGNEREKIRRLAALHQYSEAEAKAAMKDMDKKRSIHYQYYADRKWGAVKNYTITLNSSEIGYEGCVKLLKELM